MKTEEILKILPEGYAIEDRTSQLPTNAKEKKFISVRYSDRNLTHIVTNERFDDLSEKYSTEIDIRETEDRTIVHVHGFISEDIIPKIDNYKPKNT